MQWAIQNCRSNISSIGPGKVSTFQPKPYNRVKKFFMNQACSEPRMVPIGHGLLCKDLAVLDVCCYYVVMHMLL